MPYLFKVYLNVRVYYTTTRTPIVVTKLACEMAVISSSHQARMGTDIL